MYTARKNYHYTICLFTVLLSSFGGSAFCTFNDSTYALQNYTVPTHDTNSHAHVHAHYVSAPEVTRHLYAHSHQHEHPHEHVYTTSPTIFSPIIEKKNHQFSNETASSNSGTKSVSMYHEMLLSFPSFIFACKVYLGL